MMNDKTSDREDENVLPGEDQGFEESFTVDQVASAFGVSVDRVRSAVEGEFGAAAGNGIDSRHAQHLADVLIGDRPQAEREAALMTLGAYTPRSDAAEATAEEKPEGEQSDKMRRFDDGPGDGSPRQE